MSQTPIPGRGYGAPFHTLPLGAPALRAYCASLGVFGPSVVPSINQKSWIHPWARTNPLKIYPYVLTKVHEILGYCL